MAEFAIVLPVFLLLLFGVIQFGVAFKDYLALTDAVRAGARTAAVSRHTDPVAEGERQVRATAVDLDNDQLQVEVAVTGPTTRPGGEVTVRATYPYRIDLLGLVLASGRLETTTTERME